MVPAGITQTYVQAPTSGKRLPAATSTQTLAQFTHGSEKAGKIHSEPLAKDRISLTFRAGFANKGPLFL